MKQYRKGKRVKNRKRGSVRGQLGNIGRGSGRERIKWEER